MGTKSRRVARAGQRPSGRAELRHGFAARLKALREHRGKTQVQLAAEIGCPVWKLSRIECGAIVFPPSFEVLVALRRALHGSLDYLLAGDSAEVPRDARVAARMPAVNRLSPEETEGLLRVLDVFLDERQAAASAELA